MDEKPDKPTKVTELRRQAEDLLRATKHDVAAMPVKDVQQLVYELQVHQIELDMQNEELRRTRLELEAARDRYVDLYDFSPAGHLTLDRSGTIVEANLRAAMLLDINRNELIGLPLTRFVALDDRDNFHRHCQEIMRTGTGQSCEVKLEEKAGVSRWLYLESLAVHEESGRITHWRTAMLDITGRKQAEEMVVQSIERLTLATRAADIGVWDWDIAKNELVWDDQMFALYGAKKEDFGSTYDAWLSGVHPDDRARCDEAIQQALCNEKPYDLEFSVQWPDGTVHVLKANGLVTWDPQGNPLRMIGTNYDITERTQAEEQFRLVVESSPNGMLMVDKSGAILLVNRQVEQLFGYKRTELIGRPVEMLVPQRMRSHHPGERKEFFAHSESRAMGKGRDLYGVRKDGQEFPLEIGLNPIHTPNGMRVLASVVDISERKRAELTLQKERDFIDAVLETAGALVVVLDREGRILRFNRACERMTGYSSEEVMGRHVWDLFIIPEEVVGVKAVFERLRGGEPRSDYENYWRGKDGFLRRISWSNTVIADSSGTVDYVVSSGLDITDFKQIQEQLRKTERIAELGTLASGMAHEIGTPMNVILGRAEYLLQRTADEGMKKGLATIVTQIERITKVMNQLLVFARRKQPDRQVVDLGKIVEDSLEMFQERMTHNRITVEKAIEANVPSIHADRDQLVQVLINLVTNSLHAMPEGGRLRLSLNRENSHVLLGVSDTGHGMPEEVRSKIFEPFFTTKDFGKGTGLGLTVVKGIIEEHGGTIAVESVVDKGTTFWIRLPLKEAQTASVKREA
jgi:two-component system, sporulation sensor kinase E